MALLTTKTAPTRQYLEETVAHHLHTLRVGVIAELANLSPGSNHQGVIEAYLTREVVNNIPQILRPLLLAALSEEAKRDPRKKMRIPSNVVTDIVIPFLQDRWK